jgi:hypothetical protein
MTEIWKPVLGFEDSYQISNLGRVRNCKTGYTLKNVLSRIGYFVVYLQSGGKKTKRGVLVHRLMAQAFIPNPENFPHVNHIDGCKTNNDLGNLEWITPKGNTQHAISIGLFVPHKSGKGDACRASKLTEAQVVEIKKRLIRGEEYRKIAVEFGVCYGTIGHIKYGKTWTHVKV